MFNTQAECSCGHIILHVKFVEEPEFINPRRCDCDFCIENNLIYVSDPKGSINIKKGNRSELEILKQGSQTADFLCCKKCHHIVLVTFNEDNKTYGSINFKMIKNKHKFAETQSVSPKVLNPNEKKKRWQQLWFNQVNIG